MTLGRYFMILSRKLECSISFISSAETAIGCCLQRKVKLELILLSGLSVLSFSNVESFNKLFKQTNQNPKGRRVYNSSVLIASTGMVAVASRTEGNSVSLSQILVRIKYQLRTLGLVYSLLKSW